MKIFLTMWWQNHHTAHAFILEILATDLAIMLQVDCKFNLKISCFLCPPVLQTIARHLYSQRNGSAHLYVARAKALVSGLCCAREALAEVL